jgi:hypothetical protein
MAKMYLPKGTCYIHKFRIELEYLNCCEEMKRLHGSPIFEMLWPNKKIFKVYRDKDDNQIEIQFHPITIGDKGEFA